MNIVVVVDSYRSVVIEDADEVIDREKLFIGKKEKTIAVFKKWEYYKVIK